MIPTIEHNSRTQDYFEHAADAANLVRRTEAPTRETLLFSPETHEFILKLQHMDTRGKLLANMINYIDANFLPAEDQPRNIILKGGPLFSYLRPNMPSIVERNIYKKEGREESKVLRVINRIKVFDNLDQETKEGFLNAIKAIQEGDSLIFKKVRGRRLARIYTHYRTKYYSPKYKISGELKSSCMNNKKDYFDMYTTHRNCEMLILVNEENILFGRALLWKTEQGILFMDRIYTDESKMFLFYQWAQDNGYFRRETQAADHSPRIVDPAGNTHRMKISVKIRDLSTFATFPYMDTFLYGSSSASRITNKQDILTDITFMDTRGGSSRNTRDFVEAYDRQGNAVQMPRYNTFYCTLDRQRYDKELRKTCYYTGAIFHEKHAVKTVTGRTSFAGCPEIVYSEKMDKFLTLAQAVFNVESGSFEIKK